MCGLTWFAMDDFPRGYSFKGACLQIHVSNRFLVGALEHANNSNKKPFSPNIKHPPETMGSQ